MSDSLNDRIVNWCSHGQQGLSSLAIFKHMIGTINTDYVSYPVDQYDLHLCLLLLDLIPEWKPRMVEMSIYNGWSKLIPRWEELTKIFVDEYGLTQKLVTKRYSKTYDLMESILFFDQNR